MERYTTSQVGYISPIWRADPFGPISTKSGVLVGLHDLIIQSKFGFNFLRGFISTGGRNFHFPIDFAGHRYNSAAATAQPVIWGAEPFGLISTKIGMVVGIDAEIIQYSFGFNIFRGFRSTGVKISISLIDFAGHRYNSSAATAQPQPACDKWRSSCKWNYQLWVIYVRGIESLSGAPVNKMAVKYHEGETDPSGFRVWWNSSSLRDICHAATHQLPAEKPYPSTVAFRMRKLVIELFTWRSRITQYQT